MAMLGATSQGERAERATERALAALRFSWWSHLSGPGACTDGTQWGHTWISSLGIERMMHGVRTLEPEFTDEDRENFSRLLASEADWICYEHVRGQHAGIRAGLWGRDGDNHPESNIWNGALLWRAAERHPDHPHAGDWRERAHAFFVNGISVPSDAVSDESLGGKPVKERHIGPNFFPNYALDHHGYLNVGYMIICLSNIAFLHFDLKNEGRTPPDSLYLHCGELWNTVRRMIFADGRLARIGGDSRVRYAYCQEYLLPSLLFAIDHLGDPHAPELLGKQLANIETEATFNCDGSFFSRRLDYLKRNDPVYYTRLESDRACALGMVLAYAPLTSNTIPAPEGPFEESVAGLWCEHDHAAAMHRSPSRLASFAWRSYDLAQGMCQPPDDGDLAEWTQNLGGGIVFLGNRPPYPKTSRGRQLLRARVRELGARNGFLTWGAIEEGRNLVLGEGWRAERSAEHQLVFAALPDGQTVVGLQFCRNDPRRSYVGEIKGLRFNLPNDLFNGFSRRLVLPAEERILKSPPETDEVVVLDSARALVEERIAIAGLYGAESLAVHRSPVRRGGAFRSLYVDELCYGCEVGARSLDPGEVFLDTGWLVRSQSTPVDPVSFFEGDPGKRLPAPGEIRAVRVAGTDGATYFLLANFGTEEVAVPVEAFGGAARNGLLDLVTAAESHSPEPVVLTPGAARLFRARS